MTIGFDGKEAVKDLKGLGNYSRFVIETLARGDSSRKCLLYTPVMSHNPRMERIKALHNIEFRLPGAQGFHGGLWRMFGITNNLRPDGVDIFHGICGELPMNIRESGVTLVVTIHSLAFRRIPQYFNPLNFPICLYYIIWRRPWSIPRYTKDSACRRSKL